MKVGEEGIIIKLVCGEVRKKKKCPPMIKVNENEGGKSVRS
jgi:hypothetical protein